MSPPSRSRMETLMATKHGWSACSCPFFDGHGAFRAEVERRSVAVRMFGRFTKPLNRLLERFNLVLVGWNDWKHESSCEGDVGGSAR